VETCLIGKVKMEAVDGGTESFGPHFLDPELFLERVFGQPA
jgi:hypothetical protein